MDGLHPSEIHWIVNHYIGVSGGYLGDFSYASHREFYAAYCDLKIDPDDYPGTTRQPFLAVLTSADPQCQAAIVRGGRDYKLVDEDVKELKSVGLIEADKNSLRIPFDTIRAEMSL